MKSAEIFTGVLRFITNLTDKPPTGKHQEDDYLLGWIQGEGWTNKIEPPHGIEVVSPKELRLDSDPRASQPIEVFTRSKHGLTSKAKS